MCIGVCVLNFVLLNILFGTVYLVIDKDIEGMCYLEGVALKIVNM